ncbi:glycosyltransferase [Sphingopyxis terrae]|uniref:Glycosyl transferase family 21 n=2 Tax=Sphingopyxis terrae TaxID=33052 RepID=A0A1Y6FTQ3_9SPHN|nr:Glycosyl transferase family 21 [Sphingopyxis terrae subsp. ummariensis]
MERNPHPPAAASEDAPGQVRRPPPPRTTLGRRVREDRIALSYILPIAASAPQLRALSGYLARIARTVDQLVIVDGSPPAVFAEHQRRWGRFAVHLAPERACRNGKVAGVLTGLAHARNEAVVIADDDVRYRLSELRAMADRLTRHDVVRPQNFFRPLPWHARWDSGRSLLNRMMGGDWPGTLGVRRSALVRAGGYSGGVLFENLEMVRTICAAGGEESVAFDLFVARRPPTAGHFASQRIRQAYDEWARPTRLACQLAILPALAIGGWTAALVGAAAAIGLAEAGRRRAGAAAVFPASAALWAPLWIAERAITAWLALANRLLFGGVRYRGGRLRDAATPPRRLRLAVAAPEGIVAPGAADADRPDLR